MGFEVWIGLFLHPYPFLSPLTLPPSLQVKQYALNKLFWLIDGK